MLVECRASNRKVAKPRFDFRCGSASLYSWERLLMLFSTLEPSSQSRTFKYHMTLQEGKGFAQTIKSAVI